MKFKKILCNVAFKMDIRIPGKKNHEIVVFKNRSNFVIFGKKFH